MAKFLTTRGASSEIENIINTAKSHLVLISPFLRIPESLFQSLKDADRRKVRITLVYGKKELHPDEKSQLKQLDNVSLYFLDNLHAKCFFNEGNMVITSMNLYDFSEHKNREMGVLISKEDDEQVFSEAAKEADRIVHLSQKDELGKLKAKSYSSKTKQSGHCIRCGTPIPYDLEKPFCRDCFYDWSDWDTPDYHKEHWCHACGKSAPTSKAQPQCGSCYWKSRG